MAEEGAQKRHMKGQRECTDKHEDERPIKEGAQKITRNWTIWS